MIEDLEMEDVSPARLALRYYGGKWQLASWIIQHFPEHRVYNVWQEECPPDALRATKKIIGIPDVSAEKTPDQASPEVPAENSKPAKSNDFIKKSLEEKSSLPVGEELNQRYGITVSDIFQALNQGIRCKVITKNGTYIFERFNNTHCFVRFGGTSNIASHDYLTNAFSKYLQSSGFSIRLEETSKKHQKNIGMDL